MHNRYFGNDWLKGMVCLALMILCNLILGSRYIIKAQSMIDLESNYRHENVYNYYLQNVYNYNVGVRSGWLNKRGVMRPYIDFTWQIPVNSMLQFGVKSLAMMEDEYKIVQYKNSVNLPSSFLHLADLELMDQYLDLSLMAWIKTDLTARINYTMGIILHNLSNNFDTFTTSEQINGGMLHVIKLNLDNGKINFAGLYDFSQNHIFSGINSSFMTQNLNARQTKTRDDHFLSNADIRLGISPGIIFQFVYDHDIKKWQNKYSTSLRFFLKIENDYLNISPGITIYYNSQHTVPSLEFFINLTLLRL